MHVMFTNKRLKYSFLLKYMHDAYKQVYIIVSGNAKFYDRTRGLNDL